MDKRLIFRLAATAAGAAALLFATPGVALAGSVTVTPTTVAPGHKITVHVVCKGAGDERVEVFWGRDERHPEEKRTIKLRHGSGETEFLIPHGTKPSTHVAGVFCPSARHPITTRFTVAPHGAPQAGGGPVSSGGPVLLGAGVLAAATAAGAFLLLRRRPSDPVF